MKRLLLLLLVACVPVSAIVKLGIPVGDPTWHTFNQNSASGTFTTVACGSTNPGHSLVIFYVDVANGGLSAVTGSINSVSLTQLAGGSVTTGNARVFTEYAVDPGVGSLSWSLSYTQASADIYPQIVQYCGVPTSPFGVTNTIANSTSATQIQLTPGAYRSVVSYNYVQNTGGTMQWTGACTPLLRTSYGGTVVAMVADSGPLPITPPSLQTCATFNATATRAFTAIEILQANIPPARASQTIIRAVPWQVQWSAYSYETESVTFFGDTNFCSNASPSTDGGPWNGGYVNCTTGDGNVGASVGPITFHYVPLRLDAFDVANVANTTITNVAGAGGSTMSDWGNNTSGVGPDAHWANCMGDAPRTASGDFSIFYFKGRLHVQIGCQSSSGTFAHDITTMVGSADHGQTWGNRATMRGWGAAWTSHTSATGDYVTGSTMGPINGVTTTDTVMWPRATAGADKNKMSRNWLIAWSQDTVANGPLPPPNLDSRIDTRYLYSVSAQPDAGSETRAGYSVSHMYAHRLDRLCASGIAITDASTAPEEPLCWTHWDGATWNANENNSVDIIPSVMANQNVQTISAFYNRYDGYFYATMGNCQYMFRSRIPWGEWMQLNDPPTWALMDGHTCSGFNGFMPHTLTQLPNGRSQIAITTNSCQRNTCPTSLQGYAMGFFGFTLAPSNTVVANGLTWLGNNTMVWNTTMTWH